MVRLHFIKNVLYLFIYCMSARIVFSILGIILSSLQFFLKKWNPFVKSKCHGEKNDSEAKPHWRMYCTAFTNYMFLCKNIASYLKECKATCSFNTHVYSFKEFSMCMIIAPFWQYYKMSITHCMLCRSLIFLKTYCMNWRQATYFYERKKDHISKKGTLYVQRTALYFVRILFLEKSNAFEGKLQLMNEKVYFDMKIFSRAALYLADECLIICMGA